MRVPRGIGRPRPWEARLTASPDPAAPPALAEPDGRRRQGGGRPEPRLYWSSMIRITITAAAFDAIAATMPLGSVAYEPEPDAKGERWISIEPRFVDRLRAMRGPGESYSDVILRMAKGVKGQPRPHRSGPGSRAARSLAAFSYARRFYLKGNVVVTRPGGRELHRSSGPLVPMNVEMSTRLKVVNDLPVRQMMRNQPLK
jgi:hypothetical protein